MCPLSLVLAARLDWDYFPLNFANFSGVFPFERAFDLGERHKEKVCPLTVRCTSSAWTGSNPRSTVSVATSDTILMLPRRTA